MSLINDVLSDLKKIDQNNSVMRKFGVLLSVLIALFAFIGAFKHRHDPVVFTPMVIAFLSFGLVVLIIAALYPRVLKPLNTAMVFIAMIIGWIMTRVILIVLFYLIFFPISVMLRIKGHDSMRRNLDRDLPTYWLPRESKSTDPQRYERLF